MQPTDSQIPAEVRDLREELDRFKKKHNDFALKTANEIDFAKIDRRPTAPGRKQARSAKAAFRRSYALSAELPKHMETSKYLADAINE